MTVRVYRSTQASAPSLNNTAGSLIALLDACLVTGYGAQTPAGWTKPYTGTNLAAFRNGAGSNQFYLRVDDTGTTTARVVGYEAMTDVNTGTNAFPTAGQFVGGLYCFKSSAATAREWVVVATEKAFWFWVNYLGETTNPNNSGMMFFGDIQTYKSGDAYHTMIIAADGTAGSNNRIYNTNAINTNMNGHYIARSYTQTGTSQLVGKFVNNNLATNNGAAGASNMMFPHTVDGRFWVGQAVINEVNAMRGLLPGVWFPHHTQPFAQWSTPFTITGTGDLAGKTFLCLYVYNNVHILLETSDTW